MMLENGMPSTLEELRALIREEVRKAQQEMIRDLRLRMSAGQSPRGWYPPLMEMKEGKPVRITEKEGHDG